MSPPRHSRKQGAPWPETAAVLHVGVFFALATWGFGGNAEWVRPILTGWGCLGAILTAAVLMTRETRTRVSVRRLGWLAPLALFNLLVLVSCLTPGLRMMEIGGNAFYAPVDLSSWRPSAALPAKACSALALFDVIYISCFNLALIVHRRRTLRALLVFAGSNALVLAIFGTLQKLTHAEGLYFGLVKSPQPYFFASFIYHNHWGAFAVLMTATCLGLVWYSGLRGRSPRGLLYTPAFGGLVAVLFIAATTPLSTSRSCTVLTLLLLAGAFVHWLTHLVRRRRQFNESMAAPLTSVLAAGVVAAAGIWFLASETIRIRIAKTEEQVADIRASGSVGRWILYRDTWRMAEDRIWFGWGMASYPKVFEFYNSQSPGPVDHLPVTYRDAHNDWFQSVAEHGIFGTALLVLCGLVPLMGLIERPPRSPLPAYLLGGCGLVLLYAILEFPFGNIAVVLTWWMCFFSAVRYSQLQHSGEGAAKEPAPQQAPSHPSALL